jgi:hypothetical protein
MKTRKNRATEIVRRNSSEPSKICTIGERKTYNIFFRGEHPDARSNSEWLKQIEKR